MPVLTVTDLVISEREVTVPDCCPQCGRRLVAFDTADAIDAEMATVNTAEYMVVTYGGCLIGKRSSERSSLQYEYDGNGYDSCDTEQIIGLEFACECGLYLAKGRERIVKGVERTLPDTRSQELAEAALYLRLAQQLLQSAGAPNSEYQTAKAADEVAVALRWAEAEWQALGLGVPPPSSSPPPPPPLPQPRRRLSDRRILDLDDLSPKASALVMRFLLDAPPSLRDKKHYLVFYPLKEVT